MLVLERPNTNNMPTKMTNRYTNLQYTIVSLILLSALVLYQITIVGKKVERKDMGQPIHINNNNNNWQTRDNTLKSAVKIKEKEVSLQETEIDSDGGGDFDTTILEPNDNTTSPQQQKPNSNKNETIKYENVSHGYRGEFKDDPSHPFNNHNPHRHSWCPNATCLNSPICQPCQRRYLLILATARSGSTTLLRMFSHLPNVRLAGENLNTLEQVSKVVDNLIGKINNNGPVIKANGRGRTSGPFARHPIPHGSYACPTQHWINALNPPPHDAMLRAYTNDGPSIDEYDADTIFGFKSVRFHLSHWTVQEGATFLKENFPCAKIIINIRSNVQNQMESVGTNFIKSGGTEDELVQYNSFQVALAQELGSDTAKLIDMNDWKDNVSVLNDVIDWLGFKGCAFQELVHENHDGYGRDTDHGVDLGTNCSYPYKKVEPTQE